MSIMGHLCGDLHANVCMQSTMSATTQSLSPALGPAGVWTSALSTAYLHTLLKWSSLNGTAYQGHLEHSDIFLKATPGCTLANAPQSSKQHFLLDGSTHDTLDIRWTRSHVGMFKYGQPS